ncbi:MAG: hypothetical protein P4M14_11345 [Gammaproteobacteria bacterium]|nr:hypothetical protein [Gammaproteobacteria bacterium]
MSISRSAQADEPVLIEIKAENLEVYINLARSYEAEFSSLTHKMPNEHGIFEPDTLPNPPYVGYLLYKKNIPVGFCIFEVNEEFNDISEFYIIPAMQKSKLGYSLAATIFNMYPGQWQVRQIPGANDATAFWRKVIGKLTNGKYTEAEVDDTDWGRVMRQQFTYVARNANLQSAEIIGLRGIFSPAIADKKSNDTSSNKFTVSSPK